MFCAVLGRTWALIYRQSPAPSPQGPPALRDLEARARGGPGKISDTMRAFVFEPLKGSRGVEKPGQDRSMRFVSWSSVNLGAPLRYVTLGPLRNRFLIFLGVRRSRPWEDRPGVARSALELDLL